jgi:hypothetical protein
MQNQACATASDRVLNRKFVSSIEWSVLDRSIVPGITRALNIAPSHKSANLPACHFREAEANLLSFLKKPRQT